MRNRVATKWGAQRIQPVLMVDRNGRNRSSGIGCFPDTSASTTSQAAEHHLRATLMKVFHKLGVTSCTQPDQVPLLELVAEGFDRHRAGSDDSPRLAEAREDAVIAAGQPVC
ncbi:MAG TPA: hypothetical protein VHK65_02600 [Candidatus Dormibacteraeota bacterium]|nr:hypothetical protein [Candidatus Dormibacteraeota bacterium]